MTIESDSRVPGDFTEVTSNSEGTDIDPHPIRMDEESTMKPTYDVNHRKENPNRQPRNEGKRHIQTWTACGFLGLLNNGMFHFWVICWSTTLSGVVGSARNGNKLRQTRNDYVGHTPNNTQYTA